MEEYNVQIGQVVYSKQGRDKGTYFIVYKIIDSNYVEIVDGKIRKLENPKKKKLKHLTLKPQVMLKVADKIKSGTTIFDNEIKGGLKVFNKDNEEGD
ncbi:MAG: KOW domain-containing RNA-binding protein [Clostridia bacterium]